MTTTLLLTLKYITSQSHPIGMRCLHGPEGGSFVSPMRTCEPLQELLCKTGYPFELSHMPQECKAIHKSVYMKRVEEVVRFINVCIYEEGTCCLLVALLVFALQLQ